MIKQSVITCEKTDKVKLYCLGKISREDALISVNGVQNLSKYLKKLGYSPRTHVMTSRGFISKNDSFWKELHHQYLINEITHSDIAKKLNLKIDYIRNLFIHLKFTKKTKENIQKAKTITCLKKYGYANPSQIEKVKKQKKETCLKHYGVSNPAKSKEIQQEKKIRYEEKTGYAHPLQNPIIRQKGVNTWIKTLGVSNPTQSKKIQQEKKIRYEEKTGYSHPFKDPLIKRKITKTNQKKYGVKNPAKSLEIKEKTVITNQKKYQVDYIMQNTKIALKAKETKLHKKAIKIIASLSKYDYTLLEEYSGLQNKKESKHLSWKQYSIKHNACGTIFKDDIFRLPRCPKCYPLESKRSLKEYQIEKYLKEMGIPNNPKKNFLKDKENTYDLDIFVENKNIGFELNGLYYHSIHNLGKSSTKRDTQYHKKKTDIALKQGIRLYHIWDFYDMNIVYSKINLLFNNISQKIFARKTIFKEINHKDAYSFLKKNHLYGSTSCSYAYGLYHNHNLIQVLTFKRTNKLGILELSRSASLLNTQVTGGFSKILTNSIKLLKQIGITQIFTYADKDWSPSFKNTAYSKYGFDFLGDTGPSLLYTDFRNIYSRQKFQKHKLKKLFPESFDNSLSAKEILAYNKIYPLYTSGNWKYQLIL